MFKLIKRIAISAIIVTSISSCSKPNFTENTGSIESLDKELKDKFGENSLYTNINISHDDTVGDIIGVTVTDDAASMKMGEWAMLRGAWEQKSEVTLEIDGGKPQDFMFNLTKDVDFAKIAIWAEAAKQKVITEKKMEDVIVKNIFIIAPDDRPKSETTISIQIEPKSGGTDFNFQYDLKGNLTKFDY